MIQDTSLSQEIYLAKSADGYGGWGLAQSELSREIIDYANLRERSVSWAVTIPGQNSWCASLTDDFAPKPPLNATYQSSQPHKYPVAGAPHVGVQVKARKYTYSGCQHPQSLICECFRYTTFATQNHLDPPIS
jgi:hypothetical protein